jgi:hypothetical protein
MSKELRRKLAELENDYAGQPLVAQREDLREINRIRARLGMVEVDAKLKPVGAVEKPVEKPNPPPPKPKDHTEARAIYQAYLVKHAELERHRKYADRVAKATDGRGQTPVKPLATMGTDGGPLLCDVCRKPIVLEGGKYHGKTADVAWRANPQEKWTSWILGGLVVEIQTNGTLRIYHGYPGRDARHCCNVASREDTKARDEFGARKSEDKFDPLLAFLTDEFPEMAAKPRFDLANEIMGTMFAYDPGLGINRPPAEGAASDCK